MNNPYSAPDAVLTVPMTDDTYEPSMFSLHGRIGRLRYLAYSFLLSLVMMAIGAAITGIVAAITQSPIAIMVTAGVFVYIPSFFIAFVLAKRRLNDLDRTGWLSLVMLVPLVNLILALYMIFGAGTPAENRFGPRPAKNSRAVVICGLLLPVLIAVIGILAAIAIPAYQDYVVRAKAAQMQQARP